MIKKSNIQAKNLAVKTILVNNLDYISITDIANQKNPVEPKDVVKNWMRLKNTLEYLGLWERLNNPNFKGAEFDPLFEKLEVIRLQFDLFEQFRKHKRRFDCRK